MTPVEVPNAAGGGGGGGGGEMRRVNVVYFLSRNGRVEHPHLFRIHRRRRDHVYLRDVKRWLSEFRGKDMADSFAWSYKRRYRGGYIWQDLMDDDPITPFADAEYVLKGSELPTHPPVSTPSSKQVQHRSTTAPPSLPSITHSSPLISCASFAFTDEQAMMPASTSAVDEEPPKAAASSGADALQVLPPSPTQQKAAPVIDASKEEEEEEEERGASIMDSRSDNNNCSKRASQVLRNILRCKTVDQTDEGALRPGREDVEWRREAVAEGGEAGSSPPGLHADGDTRLLAMWEDI
ncbi:hypothetical protein OPV22_007432 [Ensete ventricosum]|uniref:SOSEKI DIX-like domain-containing protein n=1 Tax=Ensete ventricosum TaxID=4639 RepID=A0AAV8Q8K6_ENSVE|nr:hypothetical protein OPV22_007432 [Ensete ventricosum]